MEIEVVRLQAADGQCPYGSRGKHLADTVFGAYQQENAKRQAASTV